MGAIRMTLFLPCLSTGRPLGILMLKMMLPVLSERDYKEGVNIKCTLKGYMGDRLCIKCLDCSTAGEKKIKVYIGDGLCIMCLDWSIAGENIISRDTFVVDNAICILLEKTIIQLAESPLNLNILFPIHR